MSDEGRFQVAVGAVIRKLPSGEILLIHRADGEYGGGIWEIPIGRIKQFETFTDGLKREVAEETGITAIVIDRLISAFDFMRGDHAAENEVRAVVFAASTEQAKVQLSHEHDDYRWATIDAAIELVTHPGVKHDLQTYKAIYGKE